MDTSTRPDPAWKAFDHLDVQAAAARIEGAVEHVPLAPFATGDAAIDLRLKLENRQDVGAFKARGALNSVLCLTAEERARGVCATSSGNHARALAWAAAREGVKATLFMPENAYPNKIEACRELGADVVLCETRELAEELCEGCVDGGAVLVHPYDAARTIEGAGTVGLEIAEEWPEVEVVITPVGGGGLVAGSSLALRRALGEGVKVFAAEPEGAPNMTRGLEAGESVALEEITTEVQGLCPIHAGTLNVAVCQATLDGVFLLSDEQIFEAQERLVASGEVVEPAGATAPAVVFTGGLAQLAAGRNAGDPLRVAVVVSGGNPHPEQLEEVRARILRGANEAS